VAAVVEVHTENKSTKKDTSLRVSFALRGSQSRQIKNHKRYQNKYEGAGGFGGKRLKLQ